MKTGLLAVLAAVAMASPVTMDAAVAQRGDYRWQGDNGRNWEPSQHYRSGKHRERRLGRNDRIYKGDLTNKELAREQANAPKSRRDDRGGDRRRGPRSEAPVAEGASA